MDPKLLPYWIGLMALLVTGGTGCDEYYTGMGERAIILPPAGSAGGDRNTDTDNNSGETGADTGTPAPDQSFTADITGYGYRIDTLQITAPFTEDSAALINEFFKESIKDDSMNVLMQVVELNDHRGDGGQADSGLAPDPSLLLQTGSGQYGEGDDQYTIQGESPPVPCKLNGLTFTTTEPTSLPFNLSGMNTPLLVEQVELSGTFAKDGAGITGGSLMGVLTMDTAEEVDMGGMSLKLLLQMVNAEPDLDLDQDGTMDAWRFGGRYSAVKVNMGAPRAVK